MSGEACSRMNIEIPPCQTELARAVLEEKKPTVLVLLNGHPLLLDWYDEHMDAIWRAGPWEARQGRRWPIFWWATRCPAAS